MRFLTWFAMLCLLAVLVLPQALAAQGASSLFKSATQAADSSSEKIDQIMRNAAENGVGVVIIGPDGSIISQPADETQAPLEEDPMQASTLMKAQDQLVNFRSALIEKILDLPAAFNEVIYILRAASPDGTLWAFGKVVIYSLLLFGVGVLVEREIYGKRLIRSFVVSRIKENPVGFEEKMPFLLLRFLGGVGGIFVSMAVAYLLGFMIFGAIKDTAIQFTATLVNVGYFVCRFVAGLWRMILSPFLSQYRIPWLSDRDARRLHLWLWLLAAFDIFAILFGVWIAELGLNYDVYAFLASVLSAVLVLLNILMVIVNRAAISGALRNGKPIEQNSVVVRVLSLIWLPAVVLYVLYAWFQLTYDLVLNEPSAIPLIGGAYAILLSIIVVYGVTKFFIERSFSRARHMARVNQIRETEAEQEQELARAEALADGQGQAQAQEIAANLEETRLAATQEEELAGRPARRALNTFEELASRVAGILAFVAGAYAFFYIWDNKSAQMVESYADRLLDVMVILFVGYIIYHAFRIWIDTKIREEEGDLVTGELGDEGVGSSASRLATLLPLFRNFILIVVVVTILLIVLMEFGINVGPLFAGAGIVGVAVGFGSQALVRDIFAGAFFLFDDAFRKGEYLDVGGVKGTVEKISVRSFQLRHHLGALHTIPFGELQVMTNYSRDWVIMKLPLRVTYDTDVEHVRKLIKKLGQDLLSDPVIGENFIQPVKSQGVIEMQDSAMIIRVKFMTKPGDQWLVRKKVYEEIRALFEREGIKFAHREVTVRLADGKVDDLSEQEKQVVRAAAQASLDDDLLDDNDGGDDR